MTKKATGTREWATSNENICDGCSHDCRYCYAREMAVRFKRKTKENWSEMKLKQNELKKGFGENWFTPP